MPVVTEETATVWRTSNGETFTSIHDAYRRESRIRLENRRGTVSRWLETQGASYAWHELRNRYARLLQHWDEREARSRAEDEEADRKRIEEEVELWAADKQAPGVLQKCPRCLGWTCTSCRDGGEECKRCQADHVKLERAYALEELRAALFDALGIGAVDDCEIAAEVRALRKGRKPTPTETES